MPAYFEILLLLAILVPAILFLLTEHKTLSAIKVENRVMQPGLVWLQLIPLFGQVWQFFVVIRIANSLQKEFSAQTDDSVLGVSDPSFVDELGKRPTFNIGISYCILNVAGIILNMLVPSESRGTLVISGFISVFSLSGMICWVIYWVKLAGYLNKLKTSTAFHAG